MRRLCLNFWELYTRSTPIEIAIDSPRLYAEASFPSGWQARPGSPTADPIPITPGKWTHAPTAKVDRWYIEPVNRVVFANDPYNATLFDGVLCNDSAPRPLADAWQAQLTALADYQSSPPAAPSAVDFYASLPALAYNAKWVVIPVHAFAPQGCAGIELYLTMVPAAGMHVSDRGFMTGYNVALSNRAPVTFLGLDLPTVVDYSAFVLAATLQWPGPFSPHDAIMLQIVADADAAPAIAFRARPAVVDRVRGKVGICFSPLSSVTGLTANQYAAVWPEYTYGYGAKFQSVVAQGYAIGTAGAASIVAETIGQAEPMAQVDLYPAASEVSDNLDAMGCQVFSARADAYTGTVAQWGATLEW